MKTKYVMIAALATMMAACSNDENVMNDGPVAAQVSAEISNRAVSRTTVGDNGTEWENKDKIGISTINGTGTDAPKTQYANIPYIYDTDTQEGKFKFDESATEKKPIYFEDAKEVTFCAYYPYYPEELTNGEITGILTDGAEQNGIDYLFAKGAKASKSSPEVRFVNDDVDASFHHCMSQLTFSFSQGDGVTNGEFASLTGLKIEGVVNSGSFNTTTGEATAKSADIQESDKGINSTISNETETPTASVILFPQIAPIDGGKFKISLKLNGISYGATLTLPGDDTEAKGEFTAGVSVSYSITIEKTALKVNGGAQISDWKTETGGSGTATIQ